MTNSKLKTLIILTLVLFPTCFFAQNADVIVEQPKAIEKLLEYKKDLKTVDVFKIQIYSGYSESQAENIKSGFRNKFAEFPAVIEFQSPNYKIWVGNFINRIEADRAFLKIKAHFTDALIIRPKKD